MNHCRNNMGIDELFYDSLDDKDEYDIRDLRPRLKRYEEYLANVEKAEKNKDYELFEYRQEGNDGWFYLGKFYDPNQTRIYEDDEDKIDKFHSNFIKITEYDNNKQRIKLVKTPRTKKIRFGPNTYQIMKQIDAINSLLYRPLPEHKPLLNIFRPRDDVQWPNVESNHIDEWFFLNDDAYLGVKDQRNFVEKAMNTQDFAFLEGPPGSGKTTVLCELVMQMILQKKRVLVCASTHIAIDNIIERLTDKNNARKSELLVIRIGDQDKISEKAKPYQYNQFIKTQQNELSKYLIQQQSRTGSQDMFLNMLRRSTDIEIGSMIRDCANVVCGTTIGILQHPDIREDTDEGKFDLMIIDEASKTTFQEFLVPALYAKRWIIVGDTKQLAPYTDNEEVQTNLEPCIDKTLGNVCLDVFNVHKKNKIIIVITDDADLKHQYQEQCDKIGVELCDLDDNTGNNYNNTPAPKIMIGSAKSISRVSKPKNIIRIRNYDYLDEYYVTNKIPKNNRLQNFKQEKENSWSRKIGWRLARNYESSDNMQNGQVGTHTIDIDHLMPFEDEENVRTAISNVERIAFPSILDSLQHGFQKSMPDDENTSIEKGIPFHAFDARHVLLDLQHRMHPEIAEFSHKFVYEEKALHTPDEMKTKRNWKYDRYEHRLIWIDVKDDTNNKSKEDNERESRRIIAEIKEFHLYAEKHPKHDNTSWTIAILSFYNKQITNIRKYLRELTGQSKATRSFTLGKNNAKISIELCTVDAFQGHEADLVFLSFTKNHSTPYLDNRNRINVALTRARYQCVILGNKDAMSQAKHVLKDLARTVPRYEK